MAKIDLSVAINRCYHPALYDRERWLVLYGGAGSGKSIFAAQKLLLRCMQEKDHRFVVTRKVARTLRQSVFSVLCQYITEWGVRGLWDISKTEMILRYRPNGSEIICVGLDDPEKIKSFNRITGYWHEEPTELDRMDLIQLNLRLRGQMPFYKQHILTFNPISQFHWLKKHFFDTQQPSAHIYRTTYRDNAFLDDEYRAELENLQYIDRALWEIYTNGKWGVLTGLCYAPWDMCPVDAYPTTFDDVFCGLDFGFNNPCALVVVGSRDAVYYPRVRLYQTKLVHSALSRELEALGLKDGTPIYADAAEPDRIEQLYQDGFNVIPADKGRGSVRAGVLFVRSCQIMDHPDNVELRKEMETYKWAEDKDGRLLEEPIDYNNHALDALRYALMSHVGVGKNLMGVSAI